MNKKIEIIFRASLFLFIAVVLFGFAIQKANAGTPIGFSNNSWNETLITIDLDKTEYLPGEKIVFSANGFSRVTDNGNNVHDGNGVALIASIPDSGCNISPVFWYGQRVFEEQDYSVPINIVNGNCNVPTTPGNYNYIMELRVTGEGANSVTNFYNVPFKVKCVPNNSSCAANTCSDKTCNDGCKDIPGTKTDGVCCVPNNSSCAANTCSDKTCNDGCKDIPGTKTPNCPFLACLISFNDQVCGTDGCGGTCYGKMPNFSPVPVAPIPSCSASFSPTILSAPGSARLTWSSSNADLVMASCTGPLPIPYADYGLRNNTDGGFPFTFSSTQTGTESCTFTPFYGGVSGAPCRASVSISGHASGGDSGVPSGMATFNPRSVNAPGMSRLSWQSNGADLVLASCTGPLPIPYADYGLSYNTDGGFPFPFSAAQTGTETCTFRPYKNGVLGRTFSASVVVRGHGGGGEECIPDCSCAANTCSGSVCSNGCPGGFCIGMKNCAATCTPDCSNRGSICAGTNYTSLNNCGTCTGTKPASCVCSRNSCGPRDCGSVANYAIDPCGSNCSGVICPPTTCVSCNSGNWQEVAP